MKGIVRITLVAAILVGVSLPAPASAAVPSAVTWKVDHVNKTITVSVKLLLYPTCIASSSVRTDPCNVSEGIANRVREDILKVWNNSGKGYYYKCYKLIFEVDVKVANGANRFTVPKDRVGVQVDKSSVGFRSFVTVSKHGPWNSDDASDRPNPTNSSMSPTTWAYPPRDSGSGFVYAHEFGHVIGLDDAYDDVNPGTPTESSVPKPGAPIDLMSKNGVTTISQVTIDRLVKRSGIESTLECDYKIDTKVQWFHYESLKCGGAEGTWKIIVTGVLDFGRGRLVAEGKGDVTLRPASGVSSRTAFTGRWNATYRIDVEGIPVSTGGQQGFALGDAEFDAAATDLKLHLKTTHTEGDFWAHTPAASLSGAAIGELRNLALPVVNGRFCP